MWKILIAKRSKINLFDSLANQPKEEYDTLTTSKYPKRVAVLVVFYEYLLSNYFSK